MVLTQGALQSAVPGQPAIAASDPSALFTREASTIPQKKKNWWQHWK